MAPITDKVIVDYGARGQFELSDLRSYYHSLRFMDKIDPAYVIPDLKDQPQSLILLSFDKYRSSGNPKDVGWWYERAKLVDHSYIIKCGADWNISRAIDMFADLRIFGLPEDSSIKICLNVGYDRLVTADYSDGAYRFPDWTMDNPFPLVAFPYDLIRITFDGLTADQLAAIEIAAQLILLDAPRHTFGGTSQIIDMPYTGTACAVRQGMYIGSGCRIINRTTNLPKQTPPTERYDIEDPDAVYELVEEEPDYMTVDI